MAKQQALTMFVNPRPTNDHSTSSKERIGLPRPQALSETVMELKHFQSRNAPIELARELVTQSRWNAPVRLVPRAFSNCHCCPTSRQLNEVENREDKNGTLQQGQHGRNVLNKGEIVSILKMGEKSVVGLAISGEIG